MFESVRINLVDLAVFDVKFRKIEGNGWKFRFI